MKQFFVMFRMSAGLCLASLLGSGCMSTFAHVGIHGSCAAEGVYPGTRFAAANISDLTETPCGPGIPLMIFLCLDFPATCAFDTVLLPIDALRAPREEKDPAMKRARQAAEEAAARFDAERKAANKARKKEQ